MNMLIKNANRCFCLTPLFMVMLASWPCHAHDWRIHMAITSGAYQSSDALNTFLSENLEAQNLTANPPQCSGSYPPIEWLKQGSRMEDEEMQRRCMDHFYTVKPERTPGQGGELNDWSEPSVVGSIWSIWTFTANSFIWATQDGIQGPDLMGPNVYKWDNARNYEFAALTNATPDARNMNMAMMLYTLGHVLHLNQDLTSPDRARDAAHLLTAYFEDYGLDNFYSSKANQWFTLQRHGWPYWQTNGFSKLLDFWDTGKYGGGSSETLGKEAGNTLKLGLAEFSNGNFLGETALYKECYNPDDIHYFPFPSLANTTEPQLKPGHPAGTVIGGITLRNHKSGDRGYLSKTNAGISVTYHSALHYLAILNSPRLGNAQMRITLTIHDDNVLQEYHEKLIPKAVEYSAGILDYFFRGTMDASVIGYDTNLLQYTNLIVNPSGQDFSGGSFSIYQDDTNGIRTLIATNFLDQTLSDGDSMAMTFPSSTPQSTNLVLVYQGTIVPTGGGPSDPVDTNIGIAVKKFMPWIEQTKTYSYNPALAALGLTNGATITTNLESDDFSFTLTPGRYGMTVNYAAFDDGGTIGGVPATNDVFIACGEPGGMANTIIPADQISISSDGKRLSVGITATDNPNCRGYIGWIEVSITWRAAPPAP